MPISIGRFRGQTGRITVEDGADKTLIVYRSGRTTPDWLDSLATKPLRQVLAQLLLSWDVFGDDGTPLQPPAITEPVWASARRVALLMAAKSALEARADATAAAPASAAAPAEDTLAPTPDPDIQVGVPVPGKLRGRKAISQQLRDTFDPLAGITLDAVVAELNTFDPAELGLAWVGAVSVAGLQGETLLDAFGSGLTPTGEAALDEDMFVAAWGVILGEIPQYFLSLVFNKILEDMRPGK